MSVSLRVQTTRACIAIKSNDDLLEAFGTRHADPRSDVASRSPYNRRSQRTAHRRHATCFPPSNLRPSRQIVASSEGSQSLTRLNLWTYGDHNVGERSVCVSAGFHISEIIWMLLVFTSWYSFGVRNGRPTFLSSTSIRHGKATLNPFSNAK